MSNRPRDPPGACVECPSKSTQDVGEEGFNQGHPSHLSKGYVGEASSPEPHFWGMHQSEAGSCPILGSSGQKAGAVQGAEEGAPECVQLQLDLQPASALEGPGEVVKTFCTTETVFQGKSETMREKRQGPRNNVCPLCHF